MKQLSYTRIIASVLVITSLLLSGCASVPLAELEKDAIAKTFIPPPDKASLYIYRNEVLGAAIPMTVIVNGNNLGQTAHKSYFHLNVLPGEYEIESAAENVSRVSLNLAANKNYFVWQEVKMGMWMARSLLQQVDEETGRAGVNESKLIKAQVAENKILPLGMYVSPDSAADKIRELKELREDNIITEEEFQEKKKQLLRDY